MLRGKRKIDAWARALLGMDGLGKGRPVVSMNIVCYLVFAGTGSCAFLVGAVIDLLMRFRPPAWTRRLSPTTDAGLLVGPLIASIGALFLIVDLGVPERFVLALLSPTSILTWGAWSLLLFVMFAMLALVLSPFAVSFVGRVVEAACQAVASACAAFVLLYSAIFLSGYSSVPFLNSPALPVLFALSSLSSGLALLLLASFAKGYLVRAPKDAKPLIHFEAIVVILEAVSLFAFVALALLGDGRAHQAMFNLLLGGQSGVFWLGSILLGVLIPLGVDLANARRVSAKLILAGSACVLLGAFFLRYAILAAAVRYSLPFMQAAAFWM